MPCDLKEKLQLYPNIRKQNFYSKQTFQARFLSFVPSPRRKMAFFYKSHRKYLSFVYKINDLRFNVFLSVKLNLELKAKQMQFSCKNKPLLCQISDPEQKRKVNKSYKIFIPFDSALYGRKIK